MKRPTACVACGAKAGIIDCHNEDYDKPAEFVGLCVRCHLMLHCRFRSRSAWERYRVMLQEGAVFPPLYSRSFGPIAQLLNLLGPETQLTLTDKRQWSVPRGIRRGQTYLDTIRD